MTEAVVTKVGLIGEKWLAAWAVLVGPKLNAALASNGARYDNRKAQVRWVERDWWKQSRAAGQSGSDRGFNEDG